MWHSTWEPMAAHVASHSSPCGIPRRSPWQPMRHEKNKKIVLKASVVTKFHAVIWWLMMILDDLVHLPYLFTAPMAAHGIPWHPMAFHGSPWEPMTCRKQGIKNKKIVLKASVVTKFHAVVWWLVISDDLVHLRVVHSPHGISWHLMASHDSRKTLLRL